MWPWGDKPQSLGQFGNNIVSKNPPATTQAPAVGCNEDQRGEGWIIDTEQRRQTGTETEHVNRANENRTHGAWLIREGNHDLSFPTSVGQFVPLFLWRTHIVEIWCESDSTHVDIVAHIVRDTVTAAFRFVCTEVTLKRDF